jgi:RNA polymerase sigma-70 factor (ECF subfamily)
MPITPASLLERLRQPDSNAAWDRFVELYTPLFYFWAKRLRLQPDDAADLVQDLFTALVEEMPTFLYQPAKRFRGWLWTVFINRHRALQRRNAARGTEVGGALLDQLAGEEPSDEIAEREYRDYLVHRAMQLMRADFQPQTWTACWEYVVVGRAAAEVAAELGVPVNQVHLAKSRVLRRLRDELQGLLD